MHDHDVPFRRKVCSLKGHALVVLMLFVLAACSAEQPFPQDTWPTADDLPSAAELLQVLPDSSSSAVFDQVQVVDDSLRSGHPVDGVLDALGKTRRDVVAVFAASEEGTTGVGAIAIPGVTGQQLLETVGRSWSDPAIIERAQGVTDDRRILTFRYRDGSVVVAYSREHIVYFTGAATLDEVAEILQLMP